jgi:hypothetical protein
VILCNKCKLLLCEMLKKPTQKCNVALEIWGFQFFSFLANNYPSHAVVCCGPSVLNEYGFTVLWEWLCRVCTFFHNFLHAFSFSSFHIKVTHSIRAPSISHKSLFSG